MAVQPLASLTNEQRIFYSLTLLKRLLPYLPLLADAKKTTIPLNAGGVGSGNIVFRKFTALSLATSALTEGTTPADTSLAVTTVTSALAQYGAVVKVSDLLIQAGIDPVMVETMNLLGEQAGRSIHTILVNVLAAGTNVRYANGRASRVTVAATDMLTISDIRKTVRDLEALNVPRFPDMYYHGVITAKQKSDLQADPAFQDLWRYTNTENLQKGTIGEVYGAMLSVTNDAPIFAAGGAGGVDVHAMLLYGPDAYASVDLASQSVPTVDPETNRGIKVSMIPADQPSKTDPLNQYGLAGWKVAYTAVILDQSRLERLETGYTA